MNQKFVWSTADVVFDKPKTLGGVGSGIVGHTTQREKLDKLHSRYPAHFTAVDPDDSLVPKGDPDSRADWQYSLNSDELAAVKAYPGPHGRAGEINQMLRKPYGAMLDSDKHYIDDLDSALAKSTNTDVQDLFRGVGSESFARKMVPGFSWIDKGYDSASLDPQHSLSFFTNPSYATVLHIQTKKGAYIQEVAGTVQFDNKQLNEHEWLLPRGLKYEVTKVEERPRPRGRAPQTKQEQAIHAAWPPATVRNISVRIVDK
jgi:hypothetical protein